jgi:hypothetical protein
MNHEEVFVKKWMSSCGHMFESLIKVSTTLDNHSHEHPQMTTEKQSCPLYPSHAIYEKVIKLNKKNFNIIIINALIMSLIIASM